jgi:hypothetical protein
MHPPYCAPHGSCLIGDYSCVGGILAPVATVLRGLLEFMRGPAFWIGTASGFKTIPPPHLIFLIRILRRIAITLPLGPFANYNFS